MRENGLIHRGHMFWNWENKVFESSQRDASFSHCEGSRGPVLATNLCYVQM